MPSDDFIELRFYPTWQFKLCMGLHACMGVLRQMMDQIKQSQQMHIHFTQYGFYFNRIIKSESTVCMDRGERSLIGYCQYCVEEFFFLLPCRLFKYLIH
jgi:hypothetical protein